MDYKFRKFTHRIVSVFILFASLSGHAQSDTQQNGQPIKSTPDSADITDMYGHVMEMIDKHNNSSNRESTEIHDYLNDILKKHDAERHGSHGSLTEHIHQGDIHNEGSHLTTPQNQTDKQN